MTNDSPDVFTLASLLGIVLVLLGTAAYVVSDFASVTALIPALFGIVIAALGEVGRRTARERQAAFGIGLLGVLGVAGSMRGVPAILALLTGESVDSVVATVSQAAMILICLVLLVAVVQFVRR